MKIETSRAPCLAPRTGSGQMWPPQCLLVYSSVPMVAAQTAFSLSLADIYHLQLPGMSSALSLHCRNSVHFPLRRTLSGLLGLPLKRGWKPPWHPPSSCILHAWKLAPCGWCYGLPPAWILAWTLGPWLQRALHSGKHFFRCLKFRSLGDLEWVQYPRAFF